MGNKKLRFGFFEAVAVAAMILAVIALLFSIKTRWDALSEVSVDERDTLTSPVFDEKTGNWSYVAIFETNLTNEGSRKVVLRSVVKADNGAGFMVSLKQGEVENGEIQHSAFFVTPEIAEIKANPRLLRSIGQNKMDKKIKLDLFIGPGETKRLRFGVALEPYDRDQQNLADMVLLSFEMKFSTGKRRIFRRGVTIPPISAISK